MRSQKVWQITRTALLFALAMVLSIAESALTPLLGLPPGVKLGLANVVVMFALLCINLPSAVCLVVLKALFGFLTRGAAAGFLSLFGGALSLAVMWLLLRLLGKRQLFILSVSGALAHNVGQLLALRFVFTQSIYTLYYLPVLLISGLIMGALTALLLKVLLPYLEKTVPKN